MVYLNTLTVTQLQKNVTSFTLQAKKKALHYLNESAFPGRDQFE
jgi:hypothetical protein